jgi:5-methylcytosine-specific restriction endonuclease McrA
MVKKLKKAEREAVFQKFDGHCAYCAEQLPDKGWHADHMLPVGRITRYCTAKRRYIYTGVSRNPQNDNLENLVPACKSCNLLKRDMSIEQFRTLLQNFTRSLTRDDVRYRAAKRFSTIVETEIPVIFLFESYEKI